MDLADELVGKNAGQGRPKVVRLRRGISTAYYAVFHELLTRVVYEVVRPADWTAQAAAVSRWVTHQDLAALSKAATGSGNQALRDALAPVSPGTERIAQAFLDLQDVRHRADYDDLFDVDKIAAVGWAEAARDAVDRSWDLVRSRDLSYRRFLALGLGAVKIAKARS
ncbi:hypothetical protein TEK04_05205 [Klenkia sp. LSe6-5]|uniref:Uncharacterized protein n=1 Tax=Klenkia sesuvii TaxID=3103137 RepID=A0ABU8DRP8_9ACTN